MNTRILQTAALVFAALSMGLPAVSQAATAQSTLPVQATYQTSLQSIYGSPSPWTGTLKLTVNPDGIIQGYYHPDDDMIAFVPVTGGRNGDQVWLDIGRKGHLRVSGTLQNGAITGGAFDERTHETFKFTARVSS
jgi:hypothetical protein